MENGKPINTNMKKPIVNKKKTTTGGKKEEVQVEPNIKECFVIYGRMNPPTIGHQRLIESVKENMAKGSELRVYLSHRQDENNPLPYEDKLQIVKEAFGDIVYDSDRPSLAEIIDDLVVEGYNKITIAHGSDRVWTSLIESKVKEYPDNEFKFFYINRDENSDDISEAISATDVRQLISEGHDVIHLLPEGIKDPSLVCERIRASPVFSMKKSTSATGKPIWVKQRKVISSSRKKGLDLDLSNKGDVLDKVGYTFEGKEIPEVQNKIKQRWKKMWRLSQEDDG